MAYKIHGGCHRRDAMMADAKKCHRGELVTGSDGNNEDVRSEGGSRIEARSRWMKSAPMLRFHIKK